MAKLNQIVAIEKSVKNQTSTDLTASYHLIQKAEPLKGLARSYRPKDDDGDKLPPESTKVQVTCDDVIQQVAQTLTKLFDVTASKDWANCEARADVVVDSQVVLSGVPVTSLLFLEKQLTDIHTFVKKLPTLDPSENWAFDEAQNCYATEPVDTTKTKKVMRNHVKAEATDKHPAQVETYSEDIIVGYWRTIKYSGALPVKRVSELVARVEKLQQAVKFAREQANMSDAPPVSMGGPVFSYLFAE